MRYAKTTGGIDRTSQLGATVMVEKKKKGPTNACWSNAAEVTMDQQVRLGRRQRCAFHGHVVPHVTPKRAMCDTFSGELPTNKPPALSNLASPGVPFAHHSHRFSSFSVLFPIRLPPSEPL